MSPVVPRLLETFVARLGEEEVEILNTSVELRDYGPGEAIAWEGTICREIFVLREGRVRITKSRPDGGQELVAYVRPAALFGHVSFFARSRRITTAAAMEPSSCYLIPVRLLQDAGAGPASRLAVRLREVVLLGMNQQLRAVNRRLAAMADTAELAESLAHDLGSWTLPEP
jgi:CRP-like cAMP-binding protein